MGFTELDDSQAILVLILGGINGLAYYFLVDDGLSLRNVFTCLYFNIVLISSTIFIFTTGFYLENILFYLILYIYPCMQKIFYKKTINGYSFFSNSFIFIFFSFVVILVFFNISPTLSVFKVSGFAELYDIRMQSREAILDVSFIIAYCYMLVFKVVAPLALSYGLFKGKSLLVYAALVVFLLGFLVSAHKSILLTPIVMFVLFYFIKSSRGIKLLLCNSVFVLSFISFFSSGTIQFILGDVLMRRVFLIPGMLTNVYFEYFTANDFNLFSSVISKFSDEKPIPLPFVIGENVFARSDMSANAGFVASGYAEAGVLGVFLYTIVILLSFLFLNSTVKSEKNIYLLACFPILLAMLETNLTTVFLTHGLIYMIFFKLFWRMKHV